MPVTSETVIPDLFELNDWVVTHRPDVYAATRFLHAPAQYACWLKVWKDSELAAMARALGLAS